MLLRLVFLLYAEDEALMPADSLYGQHYSVSALADRLRQERFEHQSGMSERRGAWASLLSLFRLVYDGGGAEPKYLPARATRERGRRSCISQSAKEPSETPHLPH